MKSSLFGFLLAAAAAGASSAPEHNLSEAVKGFENLTIEASSVPVSPLRLTFGHLTLICGQGSASLVRAGEGAVGVFFQGSGSLEYQPGDPIVFPLTLYNVRKATQRAVRARDRASVLGGRGQDAELGGAAADGILRGMLGRALPEVLLRH